MATWTVPSDDTAVQVTGLNPGVSYEVRVRARDAAGNWSAFSAPAEFVTASTAAPTVVAGRPRPVRVGGSVVVDAAVTPPAGETITGYAWTIVAGSGTLAGASTSTPTFLPPGSGLGTSVVRATVTASGGGTATADVTVGYGPTIVAAENQLPGTPRDVWDLTAPNLGGISSLQGFCDGFSVDKASTVSFKIGQSDGAGWNADIYRLGWYAGAGARHYGTLTPDSGQLTASQAQPSPADVDPTTTLPSLDCSTWAATLTWTPPVWAPSGMYLLRLNRTGGGASHILWVLRDDARSADLMFMPADSTWQAYNAFGGLGAGQYAGNSLYYGTAVNQYHGDCARYISHNRPLVNRGACDPGRDYGAVRWSNFFTSEYGLLRFVERNGCDVKYYSCLDAAGDPDGDLLATVNAALFVGHNEYWSDGMRTGWETAKAAGMSVFSAAGNEVFWRLVGTNPDSQGRPRTWECQKSSIGGRGNDRPAWTGSWRDTAGTGKGGGQPENTFTGTIFCVNGPDLRPLVVPVAGGYAAQPMWRHTAVAELGAGQSWTSPAQILGFEWDTYGPAGVSTTAAGFMAAPHPQTRYASTVTYPIDAGLLLTDAADEYATAGTATHRLVVHPSSDSGGITVGTGTCNWALGVDDANTWQVGSNNVSPVLQQATLNLLTDMGAPPSTVMGGLTAPTPVVWYGDDDPTSPVLPGLLRPGSARARLAAGIAP